MPKSFADKVRRAIEPVRPHVYNVLKLASEYNALGRASEYNKNFVSFFAGGMVSGLLYNKPWGDVDLFLTPYNWPWNDKNEFVKDLLKMGFKRHNKSYRFISLKSEGDKPLNVVLIEPRKIYHSTEKCLEAVTETFDIELCRGTILIEDNDPNVKSLIVVHKPTDKVVVNWHNASAMTMSRVAKYWERGYAVDVNSLFPAYILQYRKFLKLQSKHKPLPLADIDPFLVAMAIRSNKTIENFTPIQLLTKHPARDEIIRNLRFLRVYGDRIEQNLPDVA